MSAVIKISHLSAFYESAEGGQNTVLEDISLHVPRGGTCAIIGPSGCGKSTMLRILAGIAFNYEGDLFINGVPVDPRTISIGFIPQNFGLLPWKNLRDNIRLSWTVRHPGILVPPDEEVLLSRLGIGSELLSRFPREISGGQQQRAGLARAFLLRPDILLLDEPFSALDAITREEVQEIFLDIWRAQSVTTVLVTHYVEEALYLGQMIVVLSSAPGHVRKIVENPFFAKREASTRFLEEKESLRALLMGKEMAE